jgi:hypothetical protein
LTSGGTPVTSTFSFFDGDRTVALTPVSALKLNTSYTIEATTAIADPAGNHLSSAISSSFKVQSPDTSAPRVSVLAPANGVVNVPVGTDIKVTFTEPIDVSTISPASFKVSVAGAPIAGHFTFADGNATARFAPDAPLPFDAVVVLQLTADITDLFQNALADEAGHPLTAPLTYTFLTGTFGITSPAKGSDVLEHSALTLAAQASSSLQLATVTFAVNGQALAPAAGPAFSTVYNVGAAAATPTLTITATGRDAAGTQIAQDQVTVNVLTGLRVQPRLLGVPLGATGSLELGLAAPLATDLSIQLSVVDPTIATVSPAVVVLPAGQTEVVAHVTGVATGATTISATSARGNTWAIASVSPLVPKTLGIDAPTTGVVVVPARVLGHVFAPVGGQQTVNVPLLSQPAIANVPVTISSTNPAVANVSGPVTIAQGARNATISISTGIAGTATLTFRVGNEISQLVIVVGTPPDGTAPPTLAAPVGVVLIPSASVGSVYTAPGSQSAFGATILSSPAATATTVIVTSSNPSVASVSGPVTIVAGSRVATLTIISGAAGTATLTLRAGTETRQLTIVVGPPAPGTAPPIMAHPVGVVVLGAPSAGRLITSPAAHPSFALQLLSAPAASATTVSVSTTDANIASVSGPVIVLAGARVATVTLATGVAGNATLTFHAGTETRELTVTVGTPAPGTEPATIASPVGVAVIQQRLLGTVFSAIGGQPTVNLTLLSNPAASATAVVATTTDASVASVTGSPVVPVGSRVASVHIVTGVQGVATITLHAGTDVAQIVVVVGTPPASQMPLVTARIVGVEVKQ